MTLISLVRRNKIEIVGTLWPGGDGNRRNPVGVGGMEGESTGEMTRFGDIWRTIWKPSSVETS